MKVFTSCSDTVYSYGRVYHSLATCLKRLGHDVKVITDDKKKAFIAVDGPQSEVDSEYLLTFWETSKLKKVQVSRLREFPNRKIVVTCDQAVELFRQEGVKASKIILASDYQPLPLPSFQTFSFYTIYNDHVTQGFRKRTMDVLAAFVRAFPTAPNVRLVVKNSPNCTKFDVFDSRIQVIAEIQPDISYLHRDNHIFVSASCAEGWGYPHHDAIAHGRPVICPAIGGPLEFLDSSCAWLLPYKKIPAPPHVYEGAGDIGRINVDELAYAMRYAYENKADVMEKGVNGFIRARNFTLDQMTVSVKKAFNL
jgi:glycosyltransferase involved in cell wall biosynthesis